MDPFATSHFSHDVLLRDLRSLDGQDRRTTAVLLSRVVEVEERGLFLREGYPSMHAYCIQGLHWCEGTASRRIYAARAARRFPVLFDAVADGRLHVTGVLMLSRYLSSGNVDELLAAATHKSKAEIQQLIADRFPQPDLPEALQAITPPPAPTVAVPQSGQHSPEIADAFIPSNPPTAPGPTRQHSPENAYAVISTACPPAPVPQATPRIVEPARPRVTPLAPERFGLQVTLDRETHELLQQARALMSHQIPAGEIAPVLKRALELLVTQLEKQKYAATTRPGPSRPSASARHIPAAVKRAVRERDGGRCTFVSDSGQRCPARDRLEFDHQEPVARGGEATVKGIRLFCRAHNQHAADGAFGAEFMSEKRAEARARAGAVKRAKASAGAAASTSARPDPARGPAAL